MNNELDTTLTTIGGLVDDITGDARGCAKCGRSVSASPSDDFCSETCESAWLSTRTGPPPIDGGQSPDANLPERQPAASLAFLGAPPEGAFLKAGHEVLDDVAAFVSRFSVFPDEHCVPVLVLWYAHTHAVDRFYITPRLILDSPEPGSGKTRVLEVAAHLVAAPEMTVSATPAALFRLVSQGPITVLFDEVDAIFRADGAGNEDLRGLLNAGYKNGATVARCVGDAKAMKVQRFPVFAPAALAGIAGGMPDTITTRAVTIHMRKRRSDQPVEQFRYRAVLRDAKPVRDGLATWVKTVADEVAAAEPDMPAGVTDRSAEIWEPLLAIADAAGGHWPATARAACTQFVLNSGPQVRSHGVQLLADLRDIYTRHSAERLPTAVLIPELRGLDESPWADLDGKMLDARRMARELSRYGVRVVAFKHDGTTVKGYTTYPTDRQVGLADAWIRYLPAEDTGNPGNPGNRPGQPVTDAEPVTDASVTGDPSAIEPDRYRSSSNHAPIGNRATSEVTAVTDVTDLRRGQA